MTPKRRALFALLFIALALPSCGGGVNETTPAVTGNVSVALTDAPSYAFDNVWVTVRAVWFHQVETAAFDPTATGWIRFTLDNGVTVNLAALSGDNNVVTVFDNLALPVGTYRQVLLFLEPTENSRTASANAAGLRVNNQIDAGSLHAALRVPNAAQGIRVAGPFVIAKNTLLRLAIDLNIGRDVLPFDRGAVQEFLLQPRPAAFDLDNAGAIVGFIDNAAARDNAALLEVLAEQVVTDPGTGLSKHVVRRAAAVDNATGRFVLYPLVPSATTSERYDIVIRGIGWQTAIVTSVPVTVGTTPASGATHLGTAASPIRMAQPALPDFRIAATISSTSGALATFYQFAGATTPYIIRQANFGPLSGTIGDFPLSNGLVGTATFASSGSPITLSFAPPTDGTGAYWLVAEAPLFNSSASPGPGGGAPLVNPSTALNPFSITGLNPAVPAVPTVDIVSATAQSADIPLDNVVFFATFGGTILNAQVVAPATSSPVTGAISNLPGGATGATFSLGSYGVSLYGWRTSTDNVLRIGPANTLAKTQTGDTSVAFTMQRVTVP